MQVDDLTADFIISQLLFLDVEDSKKDIKLFINSPGGSVTAGTSKMYLLRLTLRLSLDSAPTWSSKMLKLVLRVLGGINACTDLELAF